MPAAERKLMGIGTHRFLYDGETVTLFLFTMKRWMYRSPDEHYRLAARWNGEALEYLPPFGRWTELAVFRDGKFGGGFESVASRDACEPDDLPLLVDRPKHDYSTKPLDRSPAR